MKLRTTILLVIFAIVTQVTVERLVSDKLSGKEFDQPIKVLVNSIRELEIKRPGMSALLKQDDGEWRIHEPVQFMAHRGTVDVLLRDLRNFRPLGEGDPDRLAEYGLDKPVAEAWIRFPAFTGGLNEHHFTFGAVSPRPELYYMTLDGEPYLCRVELWDLVTRMTLPDLRSKTLSGLSSDACRRLSLQRGTRAPLVIERTNGRWMIATDPPVDANQLYVDQFVDELNSWKILEYVEDDNPDRAGYGLAPPRFTVEVLDIDDKDSATIEVGAPAPTDKEGVERVYVALKGQPYVFMADATPLKQLDVSFSAFRNRQLVLIPQPESVTRIEVETPQESATLAFDQERGMPGMDVGRAWYPVDPRTLRRVIDQVRADAVEEFFDKDTGNLQEYGFDPTQAITLRFAMQEQGQAETEETVIIGKRLPGSRERYVYNPRWDYFASANLVEAEFLLRAPYSLRSDQVLKLRADQVRQITVRLADGPGGERTIEEVFQRPHIRWRRRGGANKALQESDAESLELLAEAIRNLSAIEFVEPASSDPSEVSGDMEVVLEFLPGQPETDRFETRRFYVGTRDQSAERRVRDGVAGWVFRLRLDPMRDPFELVDRMVRGLPR